MQFAQEGVPGVLDIGFGERAHFQVGNSHVRPYQAHAGNDTVALGGGVGMYHMLLFGYDERHVLEFRLCRLREVEGYGAELQRS